MLHKICFTTIETEEFTFSGDNKSLNMLKHNHYDKYLKLKKEVRKKKERKTKERIPEDSGIAESPFKVTFDESSRKRKQICKPNTSINEPVRKKTNNLGSD